MNPNIRAARATPSGPAEQLLASWLDPFTARVRLPELRALAAEPSFQTEDPTVAVRSLVASARRLLARRARMQDRAESLRNAATGEPAGVVMQVLERHIRVTVTDPWRRRADLAALHRDLDLDGLLEREAETVDDLGAAVEVAVAAIGGAAWANRTLSLARLQMLIDDSSAQDLLVDLATEEARAPTRRAAVSALTRCVRALLGARMALRPTGLDVLESLIEDVDESPWIRRRALELTLALPDGRARAILEPLSVSDEGREAFLVRAKAVELLLQRKEWWVQGHLPRVLDDPSELVRFALGEGLALRQARGLEDCEPVQIELLLSDRSARVRSWAVDRLPHAGPAAWPMLRIALEDESPEVQRCAIRATRTLQAAGHEPPGNLRSRVAAIADEAAPPLARDALALLALDDARRSPAWAVVEPLAAMREGERRAVRLPKDISPLELAAALRPAARDGFGFSIDYDGDLAAPGQRVWVTRGDAEGLTLRRLLHELRTPRPDKRQGHAHGVSRVDSGALRVPPTLLAEENPTGVPGQRVITGSQGGWVPALPEVDDLSHALSRGQLFIVTEEGLTTLTRPSGLTRRLRSGWALQWRYAELSRLRQASLAAPDAKSQRAYADAVRGLGFTLRGPSPIREFEALPKRPAHRFVGAVIDPLAYLLTLGANSAQHLAVVIGLLALMLFGQASRARLQVARARRRVPLVIGGWGTRGKSGTERLKAGLMEGMGVPFLSKTTGCEAMILHAPPGGRAMELFLFRPFDKATIWEQIAVLGLAAKLNARTLLWECMGLNPIYVDLLQRGWMRDDVSTLTNAYPDHEDVMGPSGLDVARVIGGFSPPGALVLSTERAMLPMLQEQAQARACALLPVPEGERELVPKDLLERAPHAEHPANFALVASLAEQLGLDRVESMGLMAEHVLPDLGALMVYPEIPHMGRRLEFANGMSANDEVSFLHSWARAGFRDHDAQAHPDTWLVTVINNREDRIPRSRVFARIVARHAHAHAHVLIGTNLEGLRNYIEEAVNEHLGALALEDVEVRAQAFSRLRIPEPVSAAEALLQPDPLALAAWAEAVDEAPPCREGLARARAQAAQARPVVAKLTDDAELQGALLELLAKRLLLRSLHDWTPAQAQAAYVELMLASLVIVRDPKASGDRIIEIVARTAPPGARVRILGAQNIKGTGLDFAYQWVFWRQTHAQLQRLGGSDTLDALNTLEALPVGSLMVADALLEALDALESRAPHAPRITALRERTRARRDALLAARRDNAAPSERGPLLRLAERALDPFDATLRARRARQVLQDLGDRRISHRRAREILADLTARQKGGWLGARSS